MYKLALFLFFFLYFSSSIVFAGGGRFDMHGVGQQTPGSWFDVTATVYNVERSQKTPGGHGEFRIENTKDGQECETTVPISDAQGEFHGRCRARDEGQMTVYLQSTDTGERSGSTYISIVTPRATPSPRPSGLPYATPAPGKPLGPCGSGLSNTTFSIEESKCTNGSWDHYMVNCYNGYSVMIQKQSCFPQTDEFWTKEALAICSSPSCPKAVPQKPKTVLPKPTPTLTPSPSPLATLTPIPTPSEIPQMQENKRNEETNTPSFFQRVVEFVRHFFVRKSTQ